MRTSLALEALFPKVREGILTAAFMQPEKWWYLSELAAYLRTTPSSLQRELKSLVASGILQERRDGRRKYFKAEKASPFFSDLQGIFEKTAGVIPTLRRALEPLDDNIVCAFVYGSVAKAKERATSDVDLMVLGDAGLAALSPALRKAESRLGREVNVANFSASEFRSKAASGDHFITTVLRGPKTFVKGSQRDLDEITRQR
jgi:predicted nucleotidyltransferase